MSKGNGGTKGGGIKSSLIQMQKNAAAKLSKNNSSTSVNTEGRVAILMNNGYGVTQAIKKAGDNKITIRAGNTEISIVGNTATVSKVSIATSSSMSAAMNATSWQGKKQSAKYEKKEKLQTIDISTDDGVKKVLAVMKGKQKK